MPSTHVIIRGIPFLYAEKAPFVQSKMSILGALEYDETTDHTKCHECGKWIRGLGTHIKVHGMKREDYNREHGLTLKSALGGLTIRQSQRESSKRNNQIRSPKAIAAREKTHGHKRGKKQHVQLEVDNERGRCRAQLIFKLMMLAVETGHTPTNQEIEDSGITTAALRSRFGSIANAMKSAGLEPTPTGCNPTALPRQYPTQEEMQKRKEKWESPMPWPEDYFLDPGFISLHRPRD